MVEGGVGMMLGNEQASAVVLSPEIAPRAPSATGHAGRSTTRGARMDLVIEHLSKTYPNGHQALKDVTLSIPQGMFGLLGPNGAGKSTLMRTIATLQEADQGSIRLGDIDVLRDKDEVRKTLGYLPQEFGVYPKVTAQDLLDHFAVLKGVVNGRERKELVKALLEQTNLWHVRNKKLGSFSGGMRQRFGIAVALIGSPRLIIVDEPTAGLDPAERVRFLNLLSELGENSIIILSTHIVDDVSELCPRMAIINNGRILLEARPEQAIEDLRDRIWQKAIRKDELLSHAEQFPLISHKLKLGNVVVRAIGPAAPGPGFEPAIADLEDVYFAAMKSDAAPPPAVATAAADAAGGAA
jgi:ABC-type multidrug transport system ATPase subunit